MIPLVLTVAYTPAWAAGMAAYAVATVVSQTRKWVR